MKKDNRHKFNYSVRNIWSTLQEIDYTITNINKYGMTDNYLDKQIEYINKHLLLLKEIGLQEKKDNDTNK